MVKFNKKKIITTRIVGEDLVRARRTLNLSLKAVEMRTGLAAHYVQALENGEWESLPGKVYAKNWLKKYVNFLGLDWSELSKKFDQETAPLDIWNNPRQINLRFGLRRRKVLAWHKIFKRFFLFLVVVGVIFYLSEQIYFLLKPPALEVLYPTENFVTYNRQIKILGKTEKDVQLTLNNRLLTVDRAGWFTVDIALKKGLNVIKLEAKKNHGRRNVVYWQIIVAEKK